MVDNNYIGLKSKFSSGLIKTIFRNIFECIYKNLRHNNICNLTRKGENYPFFVLKKIIEKNIEWNSHTISLKCNTATPQQGGACLIFKSLTFMYFNEIIHCAICTYITHMLGYVYTTYNNEGVNIQNNKITP